MSGGLIAILALVSFVVAHEAGHFLAAKATGMKVTEFFIGFGPRIVSFRRGETEYGLKPILVGAYVRVVGMNALEEVDPADHGRTYREKPFWAKSLVVLAGVAANFLIAFVLFTAAYLVNGRIVVVDGDPVATLAVENVTRSVGGVATSAYDAGVLDGDVIIGFNGTRVETWTELSAMIKDSEIGAEFELLVMRRGQELTLTSELGSLTDSAGKVTPLLGISPALLTESVSIFEASGMAGKAMWFSMEEVVKFLGRLVAPDSLLALVRGMGGEQVPDEVRPVSPIGLFQLANAVDRTDLLAMLAFLNMVLGTLNVLPLFPLDGGHFALALYEKIRGRPADVRKLVPVAMVVIVLIGFLFLTSVTLDLVDPLARRFS